MLKRFCVRNVYSFGGREDVQTEEFSMIGGHEKLKKFSMVYGANASGKSNLVKALELMRRIILDGLSEKDARKYCKTEPRNKNRPSLFEIEVVLDGKSYDYGFEVILSQGRFVSEWLVDDSQNVLFQRDIQQGVYSLGGKLNEKGLMERLKIYLSDVSDDDSVLFLSLMNRNKKNFYTKHLSAAPLLDIYHWFDESLRIIYPDQSLVVYPYLKNTNQIIKVCNLLSSFGIGITDFELFPADLEQLVHDLSPIQKKEILAEIEKQQIMLRKNKEMEESHLLMRTRKDFFLISMDKSSNIECQTISFLHGESGVPFSLGEESDGTVWLLDLLEILMEGGRKTFVVDDFDLPLHPNLSQKFLKTFGLSQGRDVQLIVTTHESKLLDSFQSDEICVVRKGKNGDSIIQKKEGIH